MKNMIFVKKEDKPLYVQLYRYFRKLIEMGSLKKDTKMMSIRRCCEEFGLSKTTVENAYLQLAAEGYIISRPQSGYYVCELNFSEKADKAPILNKPSVNSESKIRYDFTSSSIEPDSFDFSLWQRYIKSALRQSERLISYGNVQGEEDLRNAVSQYIRENRSVICSSEQIVIGAGTQNLLSIICSLMKEKCNIAFIGSSFQKGAAIFEDHGHKCYFYDEFPKSLEVLKNDGIKLIYISPSHFTREGDILPINRRLELLNFAKNNDCIIIEDDYDSEFRYYSKTIPSMQGISGADEVIYISTFSKLLIPSIRISIMVLPFALLGMYKKRGQYYNQTASKLEQIALCQFIRDGHLNSQIKKQRKFFAQKSRELCNSIDTVFGDKASAQVLPADYMIKVKFDCNKTGEEICRLAKEKGILISGASENTSEVIFSCTGVSCSHYEEALCEIKKIIF